ncbi:MAG: helix-turn-helix transcriptional regulator [Actinomycetota bacterium]|jgi:transcriptional regulator with XRE-family HTH domain|nr:helix-turn-helix transcriptional regulator [Actinomycetota bacterium]MDQ3376169.1 helix-turn-helix transcriptional regulator [Actinomycetota bacterium]
MSGRTSFSKLREEIERDPVRRARMDETRKAYDALLHLADLRQNRGVTQAELASALGVSQPNVSKIERGSGKGEVLLGTLAGYVEALGGRLEVRAVFPEHPEDDVAVAVGGPKGRKDPDGEDEAPSDPPPAHQGLPTREG